MGDKYIEVVQDNKDKQRTYQILMGRYKLAVKHQFYFEAIMIEYALLEDRLRSFMYHIGAFNSRSSEKIDNKKVKRYLKNMVETYKTDNENDMISANKIYDKIKIFRCSLQWEEAQTEVLQDKYLKVLKSQYESLDIGGLLDTLEKLKSWCNYRNEVVHALMNKNMDSFQEMLEEKVLEGYEYVRFLDSQVKLLKKGNRIRRSINLQNK